MAYFANFVELSNLSTASQKHHVMYTYGYTMNMSCLLMYIHAHSGTCVIRTHLDTKMYPAYESMYVCTLILRICERAKCFHWFHYI